MRRVLAMSMSVVVLSGCVVWPGGTVLLGNGELTTERRAAGGFTSVRNETSLPVRIVQAAEALVEVRTDSNLQPMVRAEVVGETLVVDVATGDGLPRGIHTSAGSMVYVAMPHLVRAETASSGELLIPDWSSDGELALATSSSGGVTFSGTVDALRARLDSSGGMTLEGRARFLRADVRSSGGCDARAFPAADAELSTSSSGSIRATLDGGTVRLSVTSSGSIDWWGEATVLELIDTSSGHITHHP